jgi:hypothetical protein
MRSRASRCAGILAFICLLGAQPGQAGPLPFAARVPATSAATGARAALAADLDGDGDLDLLSASAAASGVAWHENSAGDGSAWSTSGIAAPAGGASAIAAADLDRDGDLDAVSAADVAGQLAWHENSAGDGSAWATTVLLPAAPGASAVAVGDLDGDGDPDLAAASADDASVRWLDNTVGDASAWTAHVAFAAAPGASALAAADLDGDGDLDLAVASSTDATLRWLENAAGDASIWTPHVVFAAAPGASAVAAADLDRDGDLDLALASAGDGDVRWLENTAGDASAWTAHLVFGLAPGAAALSACDVDADGDPDLAVASQVDGKLRWLENAAGDASAWTPRTVLTVPGALAAGIADVDGDGDADLVSASAGDDTVGWIENESLHGSALYAAPVVIATGDFPVQLVPGDVDRDGDLDLLAALEYENAVAWFENQGGSPPVLVRRTLDSALTFASQVELADLDRDGDLDAAAASEFSGLIVWYESDGGSPPAWTKRTVDASAPTVRPVQAADVDRDGDLDLVATHSNGDHVWYDNDGGSPPAFTKRLMAHVGTLGGRFFIDVADLDRDGDLDVLSAGLSDKIVSWVENLGGAPPVFGVHGMPLPPGGSRGIRAGDLDGDGDLDAAVDFGVGEVRWYENDGVSPPGWTSRSVGPVPGTPKSVMLADLDRDGDLDVSIPARDAGKLWWFESDGAAPPAFAGHLVAEGLNNAQWASPVDLDADGDLDLVACNGGLDRILFHENRGGQAAFAAQNLAPALLAEGAEGALLALDLSHEGRPGDGELELAALALRFDAESGAPLTTAQANDLVATLRLRRDDGDGSFEPSDAVVASDSSLVLSGGVLSLTLADGDALAAVATGGEVRFFVTVEIAPGASGVSPSAFRVTQLPASSVIEDRDHDLALAVAGASLAPSGIVATRVGCADGQDGDGDGRVDFPADPGCASAGDASERSAALPCDDGLDGDADGLVDVPADPGCFEPGSLLENPQCDDGLDNDGDGAVDWDGGPQGAAVDPQCAGTPFKNRERTGCGLGFEAAPLVALLAALRRRRRSRTP